MDTLLWNWYRRIGFPTEWNQDVQRAIEKVSAGELQEISSFGPPEAVLKALQKKGDPLFNLLFCLYTCEALERRYLQRGISEAVLLDTLSDLRIWAENHTVETGSPGLGEIHWLIHHISFRLFRLGRLQFQFSQAERAFPEAGIHRGAPLLAVHIPQGEPLERDACLASYRTAEAFFPTYFPEFSYQGYSCDSWLLDKTLSELLPPSSNILAFQRDFRIISQKESTDILDWLFGRSAIIGQLKKDPSHTRLQQKAIAYLEGSGKFYSGYGIMTKIPE